MRDEIDTFQKRGRRFFDPATWCRCVVILLCFSFSRVAAASNIVEIPAVLSLPTSKAELDGALAKYLERVLTEGYLINQSIADLIVKDPFDIHLSGVNISGNLRGRSQIDSRGVISEAVISGLRISVEKISIHTVIRTSVGGVDARIRLDADCSATVFDWKAMDIPVFLRSKIVVGQTQPSFDIEGLTLSTMFEKPEMQMNCTGPVGVDSVLREQAWNALLQRWTDSEFLETLQQSLEQSINDGLRPGGNGIELSPKDLKGTTGRLLAKSYSIDANGAHLKGSMRFALDRPVLENPTRVDWNNLLPKNQVKSITLSISTAASETLLQSYFAPGVWSHWVEGKEIAGFQDLMSSRFSQFVAFPALMDFPKDAPMAFATSFSDRLSLRCVSAGVLQASAPVSSWMVLQDRSQLGFRPLVNFALPTSLNIKKRHGEKTSVSIQSMSLDSKFHPKYIEDENPNTVIAHETLVDRIRPAVESEIDSFVSTSQVVQALNGFAMDCDPKVQVLRLSTSP